MGRRRKMWSETVEATGIAVRVYERVQGGSLYREVRYAGRKDRKSLGHHDRTLALVQATAFAKALGEQTFAGSFGPVTFGTIIQLYLAHRAPLLSALRQIRVRPFVGLITAHFGADFAPENLDQTRIDGYVMARRTGSLRAAPSRARRDRVKDGSIAQELAWLGSVLRWARGFRLNGARLLAADPFAGIKRPRERNVQRPIASDERYQRTIVKADVADPTGRLACMLALARHTGHRLNAICQLRASDVCLSRAAVERALARTGRDEREGAYMPHGAIWWRAEHDKMGYDAVTPLDARARVALDVYLRRAPRVGEVPMFPNPARPTVPITKTLARVYLLRAEAKAELPKLERGAWHPYRRLWASERRHLPDVDVARGGGWRSLTVLRQAYQQADAAGVLGVVENTASGHTRDTAESQGAAASQPI